MKPVSYTHLVEDSDPELAAEMANEFADATADGVAEIMSTDRPSIVELSLIHI